MECVSVRFSALMVVTQTRCAVPPKNNGGKYSAISRRLLGYVYFFFKQSTWYICIRMEGQTAYLKTCNGFVVKLSLYLYSGVFDQCMFAKTI